MAGNDPEGHRVIVCGGRDYRDAERVAAVLQRYRDRFGISAIIQGGADGADRLAAEWGWNNSIPVGTYNAKWDEHGKAAGPIRNALMLEQAKPDSVIAFPGGAGTADMVAKAEAAGVKVWKFDR